MWRIAEITAEYRKRMYELLALYARPYDAREPVICLDEKSKQLLRETRRPLPAKPGGTVLRQDYEYERAGTCNIFVAVEPLAPLEKPEFAFVYRYTSAGHRHEHMIHDWEVQEAHRQYKRRYGDGALDHLTRMYGETIPAGNLHFIMGTMAAHPRTFIVIGLLRSSLDPTELARQGTLF